MAPEEAKSTFSCWNHVKGEIGNCIYRKGEEVRKLLYHCRTWNVALSLLVVKGGNIYMCMCMYMYVTGSALLLTALSYYFLFSASGSLHITFPEPGMISAPLHSDGSFSYYQLTPQPFQVAVSKADFIPVSLPLSFFCSLAFEQAIFGKIRSENHFMFHLPQLQTCLGRICQGWHYKQILWLLH